MLRNLLDKLGIFVGSVSFIFYAWYFYLNLFYTFVMTTWSCLRDWIVGVRGCWFSLSKFFFCPWCVFFKDGLWIWLSPDCWIWLSPSWLIAIQQSPNVAQIKHKEKTMLCVSVLCIDWFRIAFYLSALRYALRFTYLSALISTYFSLLWDIPTLPTCIISEKPYIFVNTKTGKQCCIFEHCQFIKLNVSTQKVTKVTKND